MRNSTGIKHSVMTFICALFLPELVEVAWEDKVQ